MYTFNDSNRHVRDPRAHYRAGPPEPERFPAEIVLRDLRGAVRADAAPLILTRYAVLRAWVLARADEHPGLVEHARATAAGHLDAAPPDWSEGSLLRRLLENEERVEGACELLAAVADAAEAAGHIDGAYAAHMAAWTAAVRSIHLATASGIATGIAAFLRRSGAAAAADEWDRAAERLGQAASDWPPPSTS